MTRVFKLVRYRARGKEPFVDRVKRVLGVTGAPGTGCRRVLFMLADRPHGRVSAPARPWRSSIRVRG